MDLTYVNLRCLTDPWATQSGHNLKSRKKLSKRFVTIHHSIFRLFSAAGAAFHYQQSLKGQFISERKDQIILAPGRGILADFWVSHEIESCNFQNLLFFWFPETSQNLISFRQLLFSLFQRGKNLKTQEICQNDPYLWAVAKMIWSVHEKHS